MSDLEIESGIGRLLSMWKVLDVVSDHQKFLDFAEEQGYTAEDVFTGYALFVESGLRQIIDHQVLDENFYENSENLQVANRRGEYLENLPRKHSKEKFLYGIKKYVNRLNGASRADWNTVVEAVEKAEKDVIEPLGEIYEEHTEYQLEDSQDAKFYQMVVEDCVFDFTEMQPGYPEAYYCPILKKELDGRYSEALTGYKLAVVFFLDNFLKEQDKKKFDYRKFLEADEWKKSVGMFEDDEDDKSDHKYLNKLFPQSREDLFENEESELQMIKQTRITDALFKPTDQAKELLKHLEVEDENQPDNKKEELRQKLWLYSVEIIGFEKEGRFNGVPALHSYIKGEWLNRRKADSDNPIKIIRFKHPENPEGEEEQNMISYGVLSEYRQMHFDASGWLIFPNCATDFSGTGNSFRQHIENLIDELGDDVKVKEMTVDYSKFEELLADYDVSNKALAQERIDTLGQEKSDFRGVSTEFLTYYILNEKYRNTHKQVKLDYNPRGQEGKQLDVVVIEDGTVEKVIECKYDANNYSPQDLKDSIISKTSGVESSPEMALWSYIEPNREIERILNHSDIEVVSVEQVLQEENVSLPDNLKSLMKKENVKPESQIQLPREWEKWEERF